MLIFLLHFLSFVDLKDRSYILNLFVEDRWINREGERKGGRERIFYSVCCLVTI